MVFITWQKLDQIFSLLLGNSGMAMRGCLDLLLKGLWQHRPMLPPGSPPLPPCVCLSASVQPWWGGGTLCRFTLGEVSSCPQPPPSSWAGVQEDEGHRLLKDGEPNAEPGRKRKARVSWWSVSGVGLESGRPQVSWL